MIKDRRKHPRLRIPLEAEYLVAGEEEWRQGTIWTLGAGGAALLCEEKLELGTVLEGLHFVVEAEGDLPETRIEVGAEVVNIDRKADFGRFANFMLGLRFTGLGEQEFELLRQFVFRRLTGPQPGAAGRENGAAADKLEPMPIEIRFKLFDEFVEEVSENLSPSGMFIRAHRPLPPGSQFVFQFQLGEDFSLFHGTAEVVWTRRRSEGEDRPPGMGVRFLKLDLTSQKMVKRLVRQRLSGADEGLWEEVAGRDDARALEVPNKTEPFALTGESAAEAAEAGEPEAESKAAAPAGEPEAESKAAAPAGDDDRTERLHRRLARREQRIFELQSAREESEQKAGRLEREVEALREENRALETARDEAEQARGRAQAEVSDLQRELEGRRPDDDLEAQVRLAGEELEQRQEEWQALEAELRDDLEQHGAREADLRESLDLASETEAELRQRLEQAQGAEAELRQRLEQVEGGEAEVQERLEQAEAGEAELRQRLEQAEGVEAELRRSLEQAETGKAELRKRREEAEKARDELEFQTERAEEAESRLEQVRQEAAESRREWDATEVELRAQLEHQGAEEAELQDRLSEARETEAELRQRLSQARGARRELEERLAEGAEVEAELREQARELRAARDELEERLGRATARLDTMRGAAEELKSRFNGDLSAAQSLEAELAARLAEVAAVGAGLDEKVKRLTAARAGLAARLERINEAWAGLGDGFEEEEDPQAAESPAPPPEALAEPLAVDAMAAAEPEAPADAVEPEALTVAEPEALTVAEPEALTVAEPDAGEDEPKTVEVPAAEAVREPAAPAAPDQESPESAESELAAELASAGEEPDEERAPPATGAARLVGAARRAVARLGFLRKPAAGGNGRGEVSLSTLEERTEPVTADEPVGPDEIEETVRAWAAAWSEQRVEDYLSFYSREFKPADPEGGDEGSGDAPGAWLPPLAGMELKLGPISQTEVAPGRFAVQFEQSVESDSYARRTGRTLELVREADSWKIAAESFQDLPT